MTERGQQDGSSLQSAVDLFAIADLDHEDDENVVADLIDGAVVLPRPDADSVELLLALECFRTMGSRVFLQKEKVPVDMPTDMRIECAEIPLGGGSELNVVGQASVPQLPHEVPEGNRPFFLGLFEGSPSVFEVEAVHFLLSKAFQEA